MSFRSAVFAAGLAAASAVFGVIPQFGVYNGSSGPVTNKETLRASIELSRSCGYVLDGLKVAIVNARSGSTNAVISVDDARLAIEELRAARVYPTHPYGAFYAIRKSDFRDYVCEWMVSVSNEFPVISAFVLQADAVSGESFMRWARANGTVGYAMGELSRSFNGIGWHMRRYVDIVKADCTRQVKILLRRQGRSFVTRNGVNPLEPYAKRLEAILNAPRMHGMADFCAELGLPAGYAIPEDAFLSDAEIKEVCDAIMVDDRKLDAKISEKLRYSMGTDAYNAFVKEYNEGSK